MTQPKIIKIKKFVKLLVKLVKSKAYTELFLAYTVVLTLSITQVQCERSFSKLKYILNRLKNNLSQKYMKAFILMSYEKEILNSLHNSYIIEYVAQSSDLMKKFLIG